VHVPLPIGVTVEPVTVHTPASAGSAVKTTDNPDPAIAETAYARPPAIASCGAVDVKTIV
jgi:hypothetical protein